MKPAPSTSTRALVLVALLFLGAPTSIAVDSPPSQVLSATPHTSDVRVTSYNVCAEHCPFLRSWSHRVPRIVERIAATKPDVVVIVEAGSGERLRRLDRLMRERGLHRAVGQAARHLYVTDVVRVLRKGVVSVQRTAHSKRVRLPWVEVSLGDASLPVTVAGIHLSATDSEAKDRDRLYEAKAIVRALRHDKRVVLVGDFNGLSRRHRTGHDVDRHRYRVHEYLKKHGWVSANGGGTYFPKSDDRRTGLSSLSFDRAYAHGAGIQRFRALSGGKSLSDHRGVTLMISAEATHNGERSARR